MKKTFTEKGSIFIHNKAKRTIFLAQHGLYNSMRDEKFLKMQFRNIFGRELNLDSPKTFNEKLQWLKLYDRNDDYSQMVDKSLVKKYIAGIIGEEYIIPTIKIWNNEREISFDELPEKFVMKTTHDSGSVIVCKEKSNINYRDIVKKMSKSLSNNYYIQNREWPYKNVIPRIILEQLIESEDKRDLRDYKFFCFNGKVKCFKVDFDRFADHHANYYDAEGKILPFGEVDIAPIPEKAIDLPTNLNKMIFLTEKIACNHPFLRVDFYDVVGKIYFGEITFFPASGFGKFTLDEWDYKLGSWIELPERLKN